MNARVLRFGGISGVSDSWYPEERQPTVTDSTNSVRFLSSELKDHIESNIIKSVDWLSSKTIEVLGEHGLQRFIGFKSYKEGWDSGIGKPLSYRSVAVMESFINLHEGFGCEPSVFLTRDGNLQLGWEDTEGKSIEVEFFSDHIEYYSESKGIEATAEISKKELKELIEVLSS